MSFADFPEQKQGVQLLQRSLERGRLAHAYLFTGDHLDELDAVARTLAKVLSCLNPRRSPGGVPIDCCNTCLNCKRIAHDNHPDVQWTRPESKSRVITIDQMRDVMHTINLKPTEAEYKVAVIAGADRLNTAAANAFLKTLEEPPARSILILLSTEPQRILETILSRCLRLSFAGNGVRPLSESESEWLAGFSDMAAVEQKSLLARYRLLDVLLQKLGSMKAAIEEQLTARSPLQIHDDVEKSLRDRWEDELAAAIEAEYRRQRSDLLIILQRWLRDVWMHTLKSGALLDFPALAGAGAVAARITPAQAMENIQTIETTQRLLHTNVQEALALEVGLLKLNL